MCAEDTYWRKACRQFGLPDHLIQEHLLYKKCCASPVTLFLAARRQRGYICGSNGVFSRLERKELEYPQEGPSKTLSIGRGYRFEVYNTPSSDDPLVLLGRINGRAIEKISNLSPEIDYFEWINILPHHQCIVRVKPTGEPGARGMQWLKHAITHESPPQPLSVPFPADYDYDSPRLTVEKYSACSQCSLMVRGAMRKLMPRETNFKSTWLLTFVAVDNTGKLVYVHSKNKDPHDLSNRYQMTLAPCSNRYSPDNICGSHNIFLLLGQTVRIHHVETTCTPQLEFDVTPLAIVSYETQGNFNSSPKMFVSSDGRLLGICERADRIGSRVYRYGELPPTYTLHVWMVTSSSCAKVSEATIIRDYNIPFFLEYILCSMGHIYSIVGFQSVVDGVRTVSVVVVSTYSGETVWEYVRPVKTIECGSYTRWAEVELAVTREEWLSNIHTVSPPLVPFITFVDCCDQWHMAVDGLSFQPPMNGDIVKV